MKLPVTECEGEAKAEGLIVHVGSRVVRILLELHDAEVRVRIRSTQVVGAEVPEEGVHSGEALAFAHRLEWRGLLVLDAPGRELMTATIGQTRYFGDRQVALPGMPISIQYGTALVLLLIVLSLTLIATLFRTHMRRRREW